MQVYSAYYCIRPQNVKEKRNNDKIITEVNPRTNEVRVLNTVKGNQKTFLFDKVTLYLICFLGFWS